jgi:hypothetical protein
MRMNVNVSRFFNQHILRSDYQSALKLGESSPSEANAETSVLIRRSSTDTAGVHPVLSLGISSVGFVASTSTTGSGAEVQVDCAVLITVKSLFL